MVVEDRDGVSYVTFNRPDRMNALSNPGWEVFERRMVEADAAPGTRSIIITGNGRAFSAGGDTASISDKTKVVAPSPPRVRHDGLGLVNTMLNVEKPTVAMVNGPAVGLGATVALLCDCVVMSTTARIGDSHVPLGIVAGDGAIAVLPLLIGVHRAKELLLTGRLIDGTEAADIGLVNAAVEPEVLAEAAQRLAERLSAAPSYAVRATKLVVNRWLRFHAELQLETGFAYEAISMALPEHKDAMARFQDRKRGSPNR